MQKRGARSGVLQRWGYWPMRPSSPCFTLHGEEGGTLKVSSADASPEERVSGLTNTVRQTRQILLDPQMDGNWEGEREDVETALA